ncbi:sialidase family protein [Victivallis sp.]|uniref:sialidase family protein n=1 Tax=Victivallis sp. TaxID=2049020 RepID=UPI003A90C2EE
MRKLIPGKEQVVVRGIRPEEQLWGAYQFPHPYNLGDRLVVSVDVCEDNIQSYGSPKRWFESRDRGESWQEVDPAVAIQCGLRLANGDLLYFPMVSGTILEGYRVTPQNLLTPGYDFSRRAEEKTLPIPDGMTCWLDGTLIRAFRVERLPESLSKAEWLAFRVPAGEIKPVEEHVALDWPCLTRVVHEHEGVLTLKSLFPRGNPRIGPDGAIWVTVLSGEGHINPETGLYSPYYSAELFRSDDDGHTFRLHSHMEYEADGKRYPYRSGGFSDSDIEFMPDGSMVWFLRTAWYCSTGEEVAPMYFARSTDSGRTWSKPEKFADTGILPRLCKLDCGVTLLCYARPGIFVQATEDESGTRWSEPLVVMTPGDRSALANRRVTPPTFHDWDGCCCNPEMIPLDRNSALIFYSDFYFPDRDGVKRKTVVCRKITVEA